MPSKSIVASRLRNDADNAHESPQSGQRTKKRNWYLILIYSILVFFGLNVIGQCMLNVWNKSILQDKEENVCLSYFLKEKCDLSSLTDRCKELIVCFKGQRVDNLEEFTQNLDMIVSEIVENIPIPGIIVGVLAIIKYFKKQEEEKDD